MTLTTILLVDDEHVVRETMCRTLERFTVLCASGYNDAIEQVRQHKGTLELAIIDIALPGRNGFELAGNIQILHPEVKILYVSGRVGAELLRYSRITVSDDQFLQKPFKNSELLARIEQMLTSTAADPKARSWGA